MITMPKLLLVDDDEDVLELLAGFFRTHGYDVVSALDGARMFDALTQATFDLVVLDVMLPKEDGFSLCRRLRMTSRIPVIMLTAMGDHTDRVVGLEIGADDYLVKPFNPRELLARVKAVLRRAVEPSWVETAPQTRPTIRFSGWLLDIARRELRSADNVLVPLSAGEFDLLLAFAEHPQRVLTRDQLLTMGRGATHNAFDRSIDVQVSRLRRKLNVDPNSPSLIQTVRNGGYIFSPTAHRA
jgi:two-component system OmpR family response regulator